MSFAKVKGNAFEKKVADLLRSITGANWTRTPYSGAFLGRSNANRANKLDTAHIAMLKGDIANPDGYEVVIECKSHKDFSFSAILRDNYRKLDEWINEAFVDSQKGKIPYILCFNISNNGDYVALDTEIFEPLTKVHKLTLKAGKDNYHINTLMYENELTKRQYVIFNMNELKQPEVWALIEPIIKKK